MESTWHQGYEKVIISSVKFDRAFGPYYRKKRGKKCVEFQTCKRFDTSTSPARELKTWYEVTFNDVETTFDEYDKAFAFYFKKLYELF